tara:strand:- start:848 stop:1459 length:612 start_codon:yes stop_codon:yes gene_type:complete
MNKFIVFEGIDGSGKSTQIKLLEEKFILSNLNYKFFREPGGNFLSEEIRNILLNKKLNICDISETMLFLASRAQLTHEKIKPALDKNNFVICDRFSDSTFAYQGYGKKVDQDMIKSLNVFATENIHPYLTILLDISYDDSLDRRGGDIDRMESNSRAFFDNVRNGYKEISNKYPDKYLILDATLTVQHIHSLIWNRIKKDFNL